MPDVTPVADIPEKQTLLAFLATCLKRPIEVALTGVSVVLLLYLANVAGILPKSLKGGGFEVEFQERAQIVQAAVINEQAIAALSEEVKAIRARIDPEEAPIIVSESAGSGGNSDLTSLTRATVESAPQDIASANSKLVQENQLVEGKGSIWLGSWDAQRQDWTALSFEPVSGGLVDPGKLGGEELRVTRNLNLRETYPANDDSYYRDVTALGVVSDGMKINVLTKPRFYERDGLQQVWAEVTATYQPYIGLE